MRATELNRYVAALQRIRNLPIASIGRIAGIARGGSSESFLSLDRRFSAVGPTILSQPEVAIGIIPSGSGSQRLPRLLGRGRALLEVAIGCEDYDAEQTEGYEYINRALSRAELDDVVAALAHRIAAYPRAAIAETKKAMDYLDSQITQGLLEEQDLFNQTRMMPEAQRRMHRFMALGGQTHEGELALDSIIEQLSV